MQQGDNVNNNVYDNTGNSVNNIYNNVYNENNGTYNVGYNINNMNPTTNNKKNSMVNINLISMIAIIVFIGIVIIYFVGLLNGAGKDLSDMTESGSNAIENGVDDVTGWGTIATTSAFTFGAIGYGIGLFLFVILPLFFDFVLLILTVIARISYRNYGKHLVTYRVLMGIAYFLVIALFAIVFDIARSGPAIPVMVVCVVIILIVFINMIITYSSATGKISGEKGQ